MPIADLVHVLDDNDDNDDDDDDNDNDEEEDDGYGNCGNDDCNDDDDDDDDDNDEDKRQDIRTSKGFMSSAMFSLAELSDMVGTRRLVIVAVGLLVLLTEEISGNLNADQNVPVDGCPIGWHGNFSVCIKLSGVDDERQWADARRACISEGGDLVKVGNEKMNNFLEGKNAIKV
ncbi:hypothetical protein ElyMa_000382000 [Elysia marginata]|uniref:C-type lectin domain-containing protein n=1 Tax=Elysia marginata TaxID=1093978 RepID=A0AAV4FHX2_9GAST|nr:hypothetical protein ElyMa_000382000 [Elysia marginata]